MVVREELADRLVDLTLIATSEHRVAELQLHHRERRLNVRPAVVVLEVVLTLQLEVMVHARPRRALRRSDRIRLERNEPLPADFFDDFGVRLA